MSDTATMVTARSREMLPRVEDPITLFQEWFQDAIDSGLKEPRATSVATVGGARQAGAHPRPRRARERRRS